MKRTTIYAALAGMAAGAVNGIFGAGGGMILVPMLQHSTFTPEELFRSSIIIILPISIVSLLAGANLPLPWSDALPYLLGGIPGGIAASMLGKHIPVNWLHRILGCFILYGGVRYLW